MADAVASQTIFDGERFAVMKFTNLSDGGGENKVLKVDVSALQPSASGKVCNGVTITKIHAAVHGMEVQIWWDADTDVLAWIIAREADYTFDFSAFGGLTNNAGAGKTGDILFSTEDAQNKDMYAITLEMIKSYAS